MAFKADESFLEKLTMGATGTARVAEHLARAGHDVAELERYSSSNKIWSIKVKRLRLPDLMCVRCGRRTEARGKSKLEIKLSDSPTVAGREWDAGLRDEDSIALVACRIEDEKVIASDRVMLFDVGSLRKAVPRSRLGPPKSASEGAERDRTWPSNRPPKPGRVLTSDSAGVRVAWDDGGTYWYKVTDEKPYTYVQPGDVFGRGDTLVLGAVEGPGDATCPGDIWDPVAGLSAEDMLETYASVKALGLRERSASLHDLARIADEHSDERIRLEALGALGRLGDRAAVAGLVERAINAGSDLTMPMEAILILSELDAEEALAGLSRLASTTDLDEELRAAAVWGLRKAPEEAIPFLGDESHIVSIHAIIGMGTDLGAETVDGVARVLTGSEERAAAATQVLARQDTLGTGALIREFREGGERARQWALYGLGLQGRKAVEAAAGREFAAEVANVLGPMWTGSSAWLATPEAGKLLDFIGRQT